LSSLPSPQPPPPRGPSRLYHFPPRRPRWPRILAWVLGAIAALIIVVVVGLVILVRTAWFHGYVLGMAQQKASAALNTAVTIQNFNLHLSLSTPSVDLWGIVVAGAPPYTTPPLLQVRHVHVGVQIVSLLQRQWHLSDISLDNPSAWVFIAGNGRSNLPNMSSGSSSGSSGTNVFSLGIRHAALNNGQVWFNSRKNTLSADLQDVHLLSAFSPSRNAYTGSFGYRDGHIQYGSYRPLAQSLEVNFDATPSRLKVTPLLLSAGNSRVRVEGTVANYSRPAVNGTYQIALDMTQLGRVMRNSSMPAGTVDSSGTVAYVSQRGRSALASLRVNGTISSPSLAVKQGTSRIGVRAIKGRYDLANDNFVIPALDARLLGGTVALSVEMRDIEHNGPGRAHLVARGAQLSRIMPLATGSNQATQIGQARLSGAAGLTADATWRGMFTALAATVDAAINAALSGPAQPPVPVQAAIHGRYSAPAQMLVLRNTFVRLPQNELTAAGAVGATAGRRGALQVRFVSSNLHELENVADLLRSSPGQVPAPLGLFGTAQFDAIVTGTTVNPLIRGRLAANNLRVHGTAWKSLSTSLIAAPSSVRLSNGSLVAQGPGTIHFDVATALRHWGFTSRSPFTLKVTASQLHIGALAKAAGKTSPLSGVLAANLAVHGTELNPIGSGDVSIAPATLVYGSTKQPIRRAAVNFQGNGARVQANAAVSLAAGTARASGVVYPRTKAYTAQLQANNIQLQKLQAIASQPLPIVGAISLNGAGQGTFANPQFRATLSSPRITVKGQAIEALNLTAGIANHVVLANVALRAVGSSVTGSAQMTLRGNEMATARFDTQPISLPLLIALYSPSVASDLSGQTEIHASLQGPLKQVSRIQAHVAIPVLRVSYRNQLQLAAAQPIRADLVNGIMTLQPTQIKGTDTNLLLRGSIPVSGPAPMAVSLLGAVNLQIAEIFDPTLVTGGQLQLGVNAGGTLKAPNVNGQVKIVNASVATASTPLGLTNGNGLLTLTPNRLDITRFSGTVGGGTVTASGGVTYEPALNFDLGLAAKRISMMYPQNVGETFGANLSLTGNTDAAMLQGQVRIYRVATTPQFDLTTFASQAGGGPSAPPAPGSFSQNLGLNISLTTPNGIDTASPTFSMAATANLNIEGTAADPVVLGRVNINRGDMIFNGDRFTLESGTLMFANPSQTIPNVNLTADTSIQQYKLHLRFQGPADDLRTEYTSTPPLPRPDIINLLAFGQTTEASAANPTPGTLGAENLVASSVASQATSRIQKIAGISQLSVDPVLGGNGQNPGARISVKQRVTGNLFITLSTDVTSTQSDMIEIQYNLSPKTSVDAVRDQNGGFRFNTKFKKSW
jgi:translocation and assembly module TamB